MSLVKSLTLPIVIGQVWHLYINMYLLYNYVEWGKLREKFTLGTVSEKNVSNSPSLVLPSTFSRCSRFLPCWFRTTDKRQLHLHWKRSEISSRLWFLRSSHITYLVSAVSSFTAWYFTSFFIVHFHIKHSIKMKNRKSKLWKKAMLK